jgi:hypothetical protein
VESDHGFFVLIAIEGLESYLDQKTNSISDAGFAMI